MLGTVLVCVAMFDYSMESLFISWRVIGLNSGNLA